MIKKDFFPYKLVKADSLPEIKGSYFKFVDRESSVSRDELWSAWLMNHGLESWIYIPQDGVRSHYAEEKSFLDTLKKLADYMEKNWEHHLNSYMHLGEEMVYYSKKLSEERSLIVYKKFLQASYEFCEYIWAPWAMIYHYEKEVMEKMPDKIDLITSLDKPINFLQMKADLFKKTPSQLVGEYGWLNVYSPYDAPYTEDYFIELKNETDKNEIEEHLKKLEENRKGFRILLDRMVDTKLRKKMEMIHAYAFLKTDRMDYWKKAMYYQAGFFNYLGEKLGINAKEANDLTSGQIISFLEGKKLNIDPNLLLNAGKAVFYYHDNQIGYMFGDDIVEKTLAHVQISLKDVSQIKGIPACKGYAEGVVKIINSSEDLHKIRDGNIFVARYSFPSFTPYMLKSAAIVTDEGGLTNHTAVLCREYNKPCIIATKNATAVFNDGDLVEVDANSGVIRKIK